MRTYDLPGTHDARPWRQRLRLANAKAGSAASGKRLDFGCASAINESSKTQKLAPGLDGRNLPTQVPVLQAC